MKTIVITVLIVILIVVLGGFALMYSGVMNVAAADSDWPVTDWVLGTTMERSVRSHASGIAVPVLDDTALIRTGYDHYREMCAGCHGSPAEKQADLVRGFNPVPPELTEAAADWTPAELYWIIKNGIKMSGMPAFGRTSTEKDLWAMAAFTQKLPRMTAAEYGSFAQSGKPTEGANAETRRDR